MKGRLRSIISDSLWRSSGLVFLSSVLVNVFNLIFWLYMVRRLAPQDYGVLNSLITVLLFFSIPATVLQTVVTRSTSRLAALGCEKELRSMAFYFMKLVGLFLLGVSLCLFLGARALSSFLQIRETVLIFVAAAGTVFSSFSTVTLGVLTGLQKFQEVALNGIVSGFVKLSAGFFLVAAGLRVFGALMGFVLAYAVLLFYSFLQLPARLRRISRGSAEATPDLRDIYGYFFPVALGLLSFYALTNMDIILVKHFFSPTDAGFYSVAQMVGKIVLFFPGAINVVMFPKIVDAHARRKDTIAILKKCLIGVAFLCGSAAVLSILAPSLILFALTGHRQPDAVSLVKFFAPTMTFYALVNIFILYHLSTHRLGYIFVAAGSAFLQSLAIYFFHADLQQVITIMLFFSVLLFYLGLRSSWPAVRHEKP